MQAELVKKPGPHSQMPATNTLPAADGAQAGHVHCGAVGRLAAHAVRLQQALGEQTAHQPWLGRAVHAAVEGAAGVDQHRGALVAQRPGQVPGIGVGQPVRRAGAVAHLQAAGAQQRQQALGGGHRAGRGGGQQCDFHLLAVDHLLGRRQQAVGPGLPQQGLRVAGQVDEQVAAAHRQADALRQRCGGALLHCRRRVAAGIRLLQRCPTWAGPAVWLPLLPACPPMCAPVAVAPGPILRWPGAAPALVRRWSGAAAGAQRRVTEPLPTMPTSTVSATRPSARMSPEPFTRVDSAGGTSVSSRGSSCARPSRRRWPRRPGAPAASGPGSAPLRSRPGCAPRWWCRLPAPAPARR